MLNRTVKGFKKVHGGDPQNLVEKIIRERIYDSAFWKEECALLTPETLIDKAAELECVGGTFANQRPVPFLCLLQKMLQLQPPREVILELLRSERFKYVRALAAFYVRLTENSLDCYILLEPYLTDKRKLRFKGVDGQFSLLFMDEVIDRLLTEDRVFDIILPRLQKRSVFESLHQIEPRKTLLDLDL